MIRFGPAGNSDSFTAMGYKKPADVPEYLTRMGLNAFEYQFGHGVRYNPDTLARLAALAKAAGIRISVHSPYYISLSSTDPEKRAASVRYILQTAEAARILGAERMVVHSGSCGKMTREEALALAKDTLKNAVDAMKAEGYGDIHICPETMGKVNQLGDLDEVMELCSLDESLIPCIDFGHLNARTLGGLASPGDFRKVLDTMTNRLGEYRGTHFHTHFSKIEYTAGGEKRHLTFADTVYGPDFGMLAPLLCERGAEPVIICESAGTQAEDACRMQAMYRAALEERGIRLKTEII